PEDGMDVTSSVTSNILSQSIVITRTMDYWGRTAGLSVIVPYRHLNASSDAFSASNQGISDIALLWQINIFGGPALTREQFRSFVPQTFSSFHLYIGTPLGTLRSDFADPSESEPLDGLADDQLQLYAGPRLDMDRDLFHCAIFHEQQQFLRKRGTNARAKSHLPHGRTYKP